MKTLALALCLILGGCAATNVQTVLDPRGNTFEKVAAHSGSSAGCVMMGFDRDNKVIAMSPCTASAPADWFMSAGNAAILGSAFSSGWLIHDNGSSTTTLP